VLQYRYRYRYRYRYAYRCRISESGQIRHVDETYVRDPEEKVS
jgi:hypothetical protein